MKSLRDLEKRFLITAGCLFLIFIALLLLPLCGTGETGMEKGIGTLVGILFWAGIISGCVSYFLMYRKYKEALAKRLPQSRIPSYLGVWGNPVAIGIDILFLLGLIGTVYCNVTIGANRILNFLSLFITITCFYLHFLATGKVFQYLAQAKMKKGVKENERKADM